MHEEEEEYKLRGRERLSQNITAINNVCVCVSVYVRVCDCVYVCARACVFVHM